MFLSVNNRCTKGKFSRTTGSESAFILVSQWVTHRVVINKLSLIAGGYAPTIGIWCRFDSQIYIRHTFLMFISSAVQDLVIINNYDIPTIGSYVLSDINNMKLSQQKNISITLQSSFRWKILSLLGATKCIVVLNFTLCFDTLPIKFQ